jgi:hypothetical protein
MLKLDKPEYYYMVDHNPGAIRTINEMCAHPKGEDALTELRYRGIYGWMLWYLWKDLCKFDVKKLIEKVLAHDKAMFARLDKQIEIINRDNDLLGGTK